MLLGGGTQYLCQSLFILGRCGMDKVLNIAIDLFVYGGICGGFVVSLSAISSLVKGFIKGLKRK